MAKPGHIQAASQEITREWWAQRDRFELFVSQLVIDECQGGDPQAVVDRLAALAGISLLEESGEVETLVKTLIREVPLPKRASADAIHIAIAAVHRVEYLLTWNCRHIANAILGPQIEAVCTGLGHQSPIICTPRQILQEEQDDD